MTEVKRELYWSGRGTHKALTERTFPQPAMCVLHLYHTRDEQQPVLLSMAIRKHMSVASLEKRLQHARPSRPVRV